MYSTPIVLPKLFPNCVAVHAVSFDDRLAFESVALPTRMLAAVPKRRAEFIAGRLCAREALRAAGAQSDEDIPIGAMRAPIWPDSFVGSITYTVGLAAAVVARTRDARALGIDIERIISTETVGILTQTVADPDEMRLLARGGLDATAAFTTIFAVKEALFKVPRAVGGAVLRPPWPRGHIGQAGGALASVAHGVVRRLSLGVHPRSPIRPPPAHGNGSDVPRVGAKSQPLSGRLTCSNLQSFKISIGMASCACVIS